MEDLIMPACFLPSIHSIPHHGLNGRRDHPFGVGSSLLVLNATRMRHPACSLMKASEQVAELLAHLFSLLGSSLPARLLSCNLPGGPLPRAT